MHLYFDLSRPGGLRRTGLPAQRVQPAGVATPQGQQIRLIRPARWKPTPPTKQLTPLRRPDDLVTFVGGSQFGGDLSGARARGSTRREVEETNREPGHFVDQDAREAPQRAAGETDRLRCRVGLLRLTGDDPKDRMALRRLGRDSRQGSDLLRGAFDRVAEGRLFRQEDHDILFPISRDAYVGRLCVEEVRVIGGLSAIASLTQAILQRGNKRRVAAHEYSRARLSRNRA